MISGKRRDVEEGQRVRNGFSGKGCMGTGNKEEGRNVGSGVEGVNVNGGLDEARGGGVGWEGDTVCR